MVLIKIVNDGTGDEIIGNYNYTIYINRTPIKSGRLEDHNRLSKVEGLIHMLAKDLIEKSGKDFFDV